MDKVYSIVLYNTKYRQHHEDIFGMKAYNLNRYVVNGEVVFGDVVLEQDCVSQPIDFVKESNAIIMSSSHEKPKKYKRPGKLGSVIDFFLGNQTTLNSTEYRGVVEQGQNNKIVTPFSCN